MRLIPNAWDGRRRFELEHHPAGAEGLLAAASHRSSPAGAMPGWAQHSRTPENPEHLSPEHLF